MLGKTIANRYNIIEESTQKSLTIDKNIGAKERYYDITLVVMEAV